MPATGSGTLVHTSPGLRRRSSFYRGWPAFPDAPAHENVGRRPGQHNGKSERPAPLTSPGPSRTMVSILTTVYNLA